MESIEKSWMTFLEKGDEKSFAVIYNRYVDDLFAYGFSLGFQKESCKDAIQDVFLKIYLHKNSLNYTDNISGYIFKSFKNRLIDLAKQYHKNSSLDSVGDQFTLEVTVLDNIISYETAMILKEKVSQLLENISPNQREVVYLKYVVGLNHKEISDVLNINEDSARKILYRAMIKLRKIASEDDLNLIATLAVLLLLFY